MNHQPERYTSIKSYVPKRGLFDPCPPIGEKYYSTPPNLYLGFQPQNLEQFTPLEALRKGTLWKVFYDYYDNPYRKGRETGDV